MGLQFTYEKAGVTAPNAYAKIVQFAGDNEKVEIRTRIWGSYAARAESPDDFLTERLDVISILPQYEIDEVTGEQIQIQEPVIAIATDIFGWLYFKLRTSVDFAGAINV